MRFLFPILVAAGTVAQAHPVTYQSSGAFRRGDCPSASSHFAGEGSAWRGSPVKPRKLADLPPADTYAAMLRTDERGCIVPVKYRDTRP